MPKSDFTDSAPTFLVLEFTENGATSRYKGQDEDEARNAYNSIDSATLMRSTGRDVNGDPIPGVMMQNDTLARKFRGIEQL